MPQIRKNPRTAQVAIRNPRAIDLVLREMEAGGGRNISETAENLVIAAAAQAEAERRIAQATQAAQANQNATP